MSLSGKYSSAIASQDASVPMIARRGGAALRISVGFASLNMRVFLPCRLRTEVIAWRRTLRL